MPVNKASSFLEILAASETTAHRVPLSFCERNDTLSRIREVKYVCASVLRLLFESSRKAETSEEALRLRVRPQSNTFQSRSNAEGKVAVCSRARRTPVRHLLLCSTRYSSPTASTGSLATGMTGFRRRGRLSKPYFRPCAWLIKLLRLGLITRGRN